MAADHFTSHSLIRLGLAWRNIIYYAKMIDDMCQLLTTSNVGTKCADDTVAALLLMDDITLTATGLFLVCSS
jgi:hypothetical protein